MDVSEIEYFIGLSRSAISLDEEFILDGSPVSRKDFMLSNAPGPEEDFLEKENRQSVEAIMDCLSDRERLVVRLRFGFDALPDEVETGPSSLDRESSLACVAKILKLSRERVRQIEREALGKMKKFASRGAKKGEER